MHVSANGLRLIESFEGYSSTRYLDAVGVPTIGFGTTAADIGTVPAGCTRQQAEGWLRTNIARKYEPAVNALGVPMSQNQFDALVSLAYNCGPGAMGWDIGKAMRRHDYVGASACFPRYVYAGGRKLQGLINRRAAERRLFDTPGGPPSPAPPPPHRLQAALMATTCVPNADGRLEEFAVAGGRVVHRWQKTAGGAWSDWASFGAP
jgi:lysozyme